MSSKMSCREKCRFEQSVRVYTYRSTLACARANASECEWVCVSDVVEVVILNEIHKRQQIWKKKSNHTGKERNLGQKIFISKYNKQQEET